MIYDNIIIDGSNLYWRAVCSSVKEYLTVDDVNVYTKVITNFLDRVNNLKDTYGNNNTIVYLLFDNPTSTINIRKMIDENYKHSRTNHRIPKAFWDTLAVTQEILKCYSSSFVICKKDCCEADDLVYPLIKKLDIENEKTLIVSVDLDWARNLSFSENIHWFNYTEMFNSKMKFKTKYGFTPEGNKLKIYKAIRGDKSDCIEVGVPYLPENILLYILDNFKDMSDLITNVYKHSDIPLKWQNKIRENRSKLLSNYSLVDFVLIEESIDSLLYYCKENIKELKCWYELTSLPLENRMFDPKEDSFFTKKSLTRCKL